MKRPDTQAGWQMKTGFLLPAIEIKFISQTTDKHLKCHYASFKTVRKSLKENFKSLFTEYSRTLEIFLLLIKWKLAFLSERNHLPPRHFFFLSLKHAWFIPPTIWERHKCNIDGSCITISVYSVSHYSGTSLKCLAQGTKKSLLKGEPAGDITLSIRKLSLVTFMERQKVCRQQRHQALKNTHTFRLIS